ncbi:unnamed protein product [Choristocarpus tenellus]
MSLKDQLSAAKSALVSLEACLCNSERAKTETEGRERAVVAASSQGFGGRLASVEARADEVILRGFGEWNNQLPFLFVMFVFSGRGGDTSARGNCSKSYDVQCCYFLTGSCFS